MVQVVQVLQVINVVMVVRVVGVNRMVFGVQEVQVVSLDDMHSEHIWFTWSKPSSYCEKLRCHACDTTNTQTTCACRAVFSVGRIRNFWKNTRYTREASSCHIMPLCCYNLRVGFDDQTLIIKDGKSCKRVDSIAASIFVWNWLS